MRLLVDQEIRAALQDPGGTSLAYVIEGEPPQPSALAATRVRSSSLDLTVGEIFIPGTASNDLGGSNSPKREHNLAQGHTAVIRTRERLRTGQRRAAIGFPPAHVSLKGLLMTNPGHIDPGYEGPLHCTVINMGHESYALNRGEEIMRVLFFGLDNEDQAVPLAGGLPPGLAVNAITPDLLARLSIDFVDVEKRASAIAQTAVSTATIRATLIAGFIPIAIAIFTLIGAAYISPLQTVKDDIVTLRTDLKTAATKIEEKEDFHALDTRLATLKVEIEKQDKFDERLKALEVRVNASSVGSQRGRRGQ
jgi:dCTP deaminase